MPLGTPGNPVSPYDEQQVWGGPAGGAVTAPLDPSSPVPLQETPQLAPGADGLSFSFGQSLVPWSNPTTLQSVPLTPATPTNVPVLSMNLRRSLLIIQNGSTAVSPDIPPILYVGFNTQPNIGFSLGIAYNLGAVFFDILCPRDSIYVAFGPESNGGGTVVVRGSVVQGTKIA
ncbi:MAG: hypothetical protein ACRDUW_22440 [Pseudonocardiaceae bacterium]